MRADVPDAAHMLTLFAARLIVDEVAPPVFLTKVLEALRPGTLGVEVVRNAGNLLKSAHAAERITQVWAWPCPVLQSCSFVSRLSHRTELSVPSAWQQFSSSYHVYGSSQACSCQTCT